MFYVIQWEDVSADVVWRHLPEHLNFKHRFRQRLALCQTMDRQRVVNIWHNVKKFWKIVNTVITVGMELYW